jgi:multiple sugar transport system ATP-binding protein
MNFLSVKVEDDGGTILLNEGSFKIKPDPAHLEYLKDYVGQEVSFGIRPEDLVFTDSEDNNSFSVQVTVVEPLGAYTHLWLNTGAETPQSLVAVTEPQRDFKVGDKTRFAPRMEKARYFANETELAIIPGPGK